MSPTIGRIRISYHRDNASCLFNGGLARCRARGWRGHAATDFGRWAAATAPYPVAYEEYFEPYVLVDRRAMPRYDERFVGYGFNKIQHLWHLNEGVELEGAQRGQFRNNHLRKNGRRDPLRRAVVVEML